MLNTPSDRDSLATPTRNPQSFGVSMSLLPDIMLRSQSLCVGSGEWGGGSGKLTFLFPLPIPHSRLPTFMEPDSAMQSQISIDHIRAAREVVYRTLKPTPLIEHPLLGREIGAPLSPKHETNHLTAAFKAGGGLNSMSHFARERAHDGVITATRATHEQSGARPASIYSIPATIVVPIGNNPEK